MSENPWECLITGYYDGPTHGLFVSSPENAWRFTMVGAGLRLPRMYCLRKMNDRQAAKWYRRATGAETEMGGGRRFDDFYQSHVEGLPFWIQPHDLLVVSDDIEHFQGYCQHAGSLLTAPQHTMSFDLHIYQTLYAYLCVSPDSSAGFENHLSSNMGTCGWMR